MPMPLSRLLLKLGNRTPAGSAGSELVPVRHLLFAEFPAEEDVPRLIAAGEINQPDARILQFAADAPEFVLELLKSVCLSFHLSLDGILVHAVGKLILQ